MSRGYFGIGVYHVKTETNIGTLLRSAFQLGADFVFTVGRRYDKQSSDTLKTWRHIPLYHYSDFEDLIGHLPYDCPIVAVETGGGDLRTFAHPQRCVYLLGAEDNGLPVSVQARCWRMISIGSIRTASYNVAVAGAIVMYDRWAKQEVNA